VSYSFPIQKKGLGYAQAEVDEFIGSARRQFDDSTQELVSSAVARHSTFALVKGGYSIAAVDIAVDRLEDAFAVKEIQRELQQEGDFAMSDRLSRLVESLQGRIDRPKAKRFGRAVWPLRGYSPAEVDRFCMSLERFLFSNATIVASDVRGQLFRGKRGGYSESQVDAFLDRAIEVIQLREALGR